MNKEENFKTPSVALSLVPVLFMIVILIVGVLFFNLKIEILLLLSAVVTSIIAVHLGHTYEEIEKEVVDKIAKGLPAIFVVLVVGILVGAWIIGGTVPYLVYIEDHKP
ncbi:MAG TPA: hypothetical protein DC024_12345 [Clostridiales bacterium]|jgi:NhaC family Na+:H+ antiporter|nr:hypothetical protein [Clostridiales bacterium]